MSGFLEYQLTGFGLVLYLSAAATVALAFGFYAVRASYRSRALRARIGAYTGRR